MVKWDLGQDQLEQPTDEFFAAIEWGDLWEDANMASVLMYLRGSYHLHLCHWRRHFPLEI